MPVLAPVITRTGSSAMGAGYAAARVAPVDPTEARFPAVPARAGHYESFYLKLCHPAEPLGAWIRYTVHKRPGDAARGSLWFTLFERSGPRAAKLTAPDPASGGGDWLRVGEARVGADGASGRIGDEVAWELALEGAEVPLFHLPRACFHELVVPGGQRGGPRGSPRNGEDEDGPGCMSRHF